MSNPQVKIIDTGERVIPKTRTVGGPMIIINDLDPTAEQRMRLIELSGVLDFWDDSEEDIYSPEDGSPL